MNNRIIELEGVIDTNNKNIIIKDGQLNELKELILESETINNDVNNKIFTLVKTNETNNNLLEEYKNKVNNLNCEIKD